MIPRLQTERLILREFRAEDLDAFAAIVADPDVMRYLGGEVQSRNDAWSNMARGAGQWLLRGYGTWAVMRKSDGAVMGRVGLVHPEGWPGVEVGWTLGKPYWGQGYATEAAQAALNYAFLTLPVPRMISLIDPDNTPSQAVAKRIGETQGEKHQMPIAGKVFHFHIWAITREEWARRVKRA
ncbi:MAG TPA: GNAT family N-acetyltransferase [Rhizomicrobium sp.]|nr:GNAT family N-acetyltransferase [Rhizomicrobium sp.]